MRASKAEPRAVARWRAAVVLLTLNILVGLLSVNCASATGSTTTSPPTTTTPTSTAAAQAPQLCVSRAAQPSYRFSSVHGFITYSDGSEIWAVDPLHAANRISLGPLRGLTPIAWSRDGNRLLLMERRRIDATGTDALNLCVLNADGSQTLLTSDGLSGEGSFSPDGSKVVFARTDDGLYVVDANGGLPKLIARSYLAWWLGTPAWSPDGSRIAYTVYLEGGPEFGFQIWTVKPDGTDPRPLLDLGACRASCAGGLAWSPDGSMLAFHSAQGTGQTGGLSWAIYVVHADGSRLHRISDYGNLQPSWSPDGSRLAFSTLEASPYPGSGGLYTMAADGSDVRHLEGVVVSPTYSRALVWNPVR